MRNLENISSEELDLLSEKVAQLGWEKGWDEFINRITYERCIEIQKLINKRQSAWKFLMNFNGKRALSIDASLGAISLSLAQHFDEVYTFHFDRRISKCIKDRIDESGLKNVFCLTVDEPSHLPFPTGYFDVVVLHNIEEIMRLLTSRDNEKNKVFVQNLLKETYRILSLKGFVYLSAQNKYGYDLIVKRLRNSEGNDEGQKRFLSIPFIKKIIKRAKFNNRKIYSLYPGLNYTSEIMNFGRAISNGNVTHKERFKSYIFNNRLFKYFSPAIGLIANKNGNYISFSEKLLSQIKQKEILPDSLNRELTLKRYLILIDKVILTIGRKREIYPSLIIKLPLSEDSFIRCKHEVEILNDLKRTNTEIRNKIPDFYYEGKLSGQPYFILSAIRGFSIDLVIKGIKRIVSDAADILIKFHRDTSCETIIDETKFEEIFLRPINKLPQILDNNSSKELDYIKDYLRDRLIGKKINLVWEHGDFYHENMLVDSKTLEILGVIDWEMSKKEGLPLLDLVYLLAQNKILFEQKDFSTVFIEEILPLQLSDFERDVFSHYIQTICVSKEFIFPLLIMSWIKHIVYREGIQMHSTWLDENVYKVIYSIRQYIQNEKHSVN